MNDDRLCTGRGECFDLGFLGTLDHQVDLEVDVEVAQRLADLRTHRQRRDKVTIHHVNVDRFGACPLN